ncbi:MAG: alanine racemase [Bacteroidales bacterium]|nr:alanine racemase [Bacteroidales bacterium]
MTTKKRYERPVIKRLESNMPNKYGSRTEFEPVTHIENIPVSELIARYGSPVFVVSEKKIRKNYRAARQAFETRYPRVQFAWSYKTNYLNAVCNVFHQEGSWAEVVSGFEYDKAISNGVDGSKIIFNGPDKTEADLKKAITNNSLIHIDHLEELYTLQELAISTKQKPKVAIRVNMDTGVYPMWDRFGFNFENGQAWDALNKIMYSGNMELVGLHTHIGTFMLSPSAYAVAASKLARLAQMVQQKYDHEIKYIDMGGGFASRNTLKGSYLPGIDTNPHIDDFAEAIASALMNSDYRPKTPPLLILETGRALIDDAAWLLGTVIANKRLSDGKRTTIVDFGVNILFTSFWYDHRVSPAQPHTAYSEDTVIYGPLCMNIDVIRESVSMPLLNKGDQVVVHSVGAYNMTQWMQFITLRPKVVMIDPEGTVHIIRNNEKLENLMELEQMPQHLATFDL